MSRSLPVVIITYNRPRSLTRLLEAISRSDATTLANIYISVEGEAPPEIGQVLASFQSRLKFEIIRQSKKLGLKSHVLWCGDFLAEKGGGILLEDDLFVSRDFCDYALKAARQFDPQDTIAGISLYGHCVNPFCQMPFFAEIDGYDNYFLQMPSSWGQYWSARQWRKFRDWLAMNPTIHSADSSLPAVMRSWSDQSWLKLFANYMVKNNLHCAYPRSSHTTNFCEPGSHMERTSNLFQVPLARRRNYQFAPTVAQGVCYDVFFERAPTQVAGLPPDCVMDLYGQKELAAAPTKLWVTRKAAVDPIKTFGHRLKPHECNLSEDIEGQAFRLAPGQTVANEPSRLSATDVENIAGEIPGRAISSLFWQTGMRRLKKKIRLSPKHK